MKATTFLKKMEKHEKSFEKLQHRIYIDVGKYVESNQKETTSGMGELEKFVDHITLLGAWITDSLNGYATDRYFYSYKNSLTKKIRKVLGFTY